MNEESNNIEQLEINNDEEAVTEVAADATSLEAEVEAEIEVDPDQRIDALEGELAETEAKAAEYLDGWQRARAEFANARKRLERGKAEAYRNAAVDYAQKVLPILDDFDRALESVPASVEQDNWFEGILLVSRKLHSILSDLNVEPIESVGRPFDPNFHEALSLTEAEGFESGTVVEELQTGYRLDEKVIRPALVNVAA